MLGIVLVIHIVIAAMITILVLLQHGKGADMGASFGSGSSQTIFGSRGAAPFMMKLTAFFAALFFISALMLGHLSATVSHDDLILPVTQSKTQPSEAKTKKDVNSLLNSKGSSDSDLIHQIQQQSTASEAN
ncbi:preprotein translocase subunit SecG [Thiotrichales bacterium 19S11-10]|nr:preprotein translocase subunit SecG [Thiotrichales bacterium 19S11-10]MCF6806965.1 preprotein translocase subunit SecG [Thiotrichales bacterium 19S9-11]MCF6810934.1 preprotein translocase subunit SecG [Thiotrichales bacterium 19S9-12]